MDKQKKMDNQQKNKRHINNFTNIGIFTKDIHFIVLLNTTVVSFKRSSIGVKTSIPILNNYNELNFMSLVHNLNE